MGTARRLSISAGAIGIDLAGIVWLCRVFKFFSSIFSHLRPDKGFDLGSCNRVDICATVRNLIEAENERNELYGYDRMVGYIKNSKGPPWGEGLTNEIGKWRGSAKANDDFTLLEIWRD